VDISPEQIEPAMPEIRIVRLTAADIELARELFATMARVFATGPEALSDGYLTRLLDRQDFWALAASIDGQLAGGLTAYTLALARAEVSEIFIYDVAVVPGRQRLGVGRQLMASLRSQAASAGITVAFVPADNEDIHALDFYRALGGIPAPVTIFTFGDTGE
jgi:aminoglycoside 3-N-acetyltransferase I